MAVCVLSAETLEEYFEAYGPVKSVMLKEDRDTGKSRLFLIPCPFLHGFNFLSICVELTLFLACDCHMALT